MHPAEGVGFDEERNLERGIVPQNRTRCFGESKLRECRFKSCLCAPSRITPIRSRCGRGGAVAPDVRSLAALADPPARPGAGELRAATEAGVLQAPECAGRRSRGVGYWARIQGQPAKAFRSSAGRRRRRERCRDCRWGSNPIASCAAMSARRLNGLLKFVPRDGKWQTVRQRRTGMKAATEMRIAHACIF
jgi:hypothetical protein